MAYRSPSHQLPFDTSSCRRPETPRSGSQHSSFHSQQKPDRGPWRLSDPSRMTAAHRLRDLADVQNLNRFLGLPEDLAERLDGSVRPVYQKLWPQSQAPDRLHES